MKLFKIIWPHIVHNIYLYLPILILFLNSVNETVLNNLATHIVHNTYTYQYLFLNSVNETVLNNLATHIVQSSQVDPLVHDNVARCMWKSCHEGIHN